MIFPSSPSNGEEWLDTQNPSSGTWKYDSANNSWTLVGGASTANPLTFLGGHDFTQATEPDGSGASNAKQVGDLWVHDAATGAPDAVYALDTASISTGQLVVWDGNSYEMLSGSPGYPNVDDGEGTTLDDRYLKLGANAGDQTVQSTGTTTFEGTVVVKSGNAQLNVVQNGEDFSFLAGDEPSFFKSNVYIGGTTLRNTRELWESTLTEEQKEQLAAGTLAIPANVSTPGDGSFVRQWWYDQQSAEDQALIDAGELEYPERYKAEKFVDTFELGDNTRINLTANKLEIKTGSNINPGLRWYGSTGGIHCEGNSNFVIKNNFVQFNNLDDERGVVITDDKVIIGDSIPSGVVSLFLNSDITLLGGGGTTNTVWYGVLNQNSYSAIDNPGTGLVDIQQFSSSGSVGDIDVDAFVHFNAAQTTHTKDPEAEYGFRSLLQRKDDTETYNLYAAGTAPNYFAGDIDCDGLINGAFSLRMQTDDPAAFQTTYATDEEGNQVENQTYVGTHRRPAEHHQRPPYSCTAALEAGNGGY